MPTPTGRLAVWQLEGCAERYGRYECWALRVCYSGLLFPDFPTARGPRANTGVSVAHEILKIITASKEDAMFLVRGFHSGVHR